MSEKRYTAQEMREIEQLINSDDSDKDLFVCNNTKSRFEMEHIFDYNEEATLKIKAMLRQAADAEEELAQLRARLAAVVKECKRINDETFERSINKVVAYKTKIDVASDAICCAILRAARGESESENK